MDERKLLSALIFDRAAFGQLSAYLDDSDFSDKGQVVFHRIREFYENDSSAASVDIDLLASALARDLPKHEKTFKLLLGELEPVSVPNLVQELTAFKKRSTAIKLSNALLADDPKIDELIELYARYNAGDVGGTKGDTNAEVFYRTNLADYLEGSNSRGKRIRLYPKSLNDAIGGRGVLPGHHIVVFAPPETGKSLFSINLAAGMVNHGVRVLYVSNEEPSHDLLMRFVSRMNGKDTGWVESHPIEAQIEADKHGYDNLIVYGTSRGTPKEVHGLIEKYKPEVLLVDQMWKLTMPGIDRNSSSGIAASSDFMRRTGKKYGIVSVSVTQAGDSATDKLILDQNDIYMSNTAVPGDADLMIGIGSNERYRGDNRRVLSLPKNKINGFHGHIVVGVDPTISKVMSI